MAAASSKKYKLVLLGESGVGKSSLVQRLIKDTFSAQLNSTVGASFFRFACTVSDDVVVHFDIWDTAGQERFKSLASMYYRGAAAAFVVYEITSRETYERAKVWATELHVNSPETIVMLVGNKGDLETDRRVEAEEAANYAAELGAMFREASARSGAGVQEAFRDIAKRLAETQSAPHVRDGGVVNRPLNVAEERNSNCC